MSISRSRSDLPSKRQVRRLERRLAEADLELVPFEPYRSARPLNGDGSCLVSSGEIPAFPIGMRHASAELYAVAPTSASGISLSVAVSNTSESEGRKPICTASPAGCALACPCNRTRIRPRSVSTT